MEGVDKLISKSFTSCTAWYVQQQFLNRSSSHVELLGMRFADYLLTDQRNLWQHTYPDYYTEVGESIKQNDEEWHNHMGTFFYVF